jgi:hypothetical protein
MLELLPRVPFGPANDPAQCAPWPKPVSAFNLEWLKGTFVVDQRDRLARIQAAISAANTHIEQVRLQASGPVVVGVKAPNGNILRSGNDANLEHQLRTHAKNQIVAKIIEIRNSLDKLVPPLLRDSARASLTADTLKQRVFDKLSCMSRASVSGLLDRTVLDRAGFAQLKSDYANMLRHLSPIELTAYAQRAIDDGSADAICLLDSIRIENFRRPKDDRGFLNASIVQLAQVPEFDAAGLLLDEVQAINKQANLLWADFLGQTNRATLLRMDNALSQLGKQLNSELPIYGTEDE